MLRRRVGWSAVAAVVIVATISAASAMSPEQEAAPVPVMSGPLLANDVRDMALFAVVCGAIEAPGATGKVAVTGILPRACGVSAAAQHAWGLEQAAPGYSCFEPALAIRRSAGPSAIADPGYRGGNLDGSGYDDKVLLNSAI